MLHTELEGTLDDTRSIFEQVDVIEVRKTFLLLKFFWKREYEDASSRYNFLLPASGVFSLFELHFYAISFPHIQFGDSEKDYWLQVENSVGWTGRLCDSICPNE